MSTDELTGDRTMTANVETAIENGQVDSKNTLFETVYWIITIVYLLVFLGILIVFDVLQKLALPFGLRRLEAVIRLFNISLTRSLCLIGTRLTIQNMPDLERGNPYIIVCNHQSMFDIPILHSTFNRHRPKFIAKKELARWIPGVSVCLRKEGNAIIDRKDGKQAIVELKKLAQRMEAQRFAVVIFPEGTRARTGQMKQFQSAGLLALMKTAPTAQVVPCAIDGSWRFNPGKGRPLPLGAKITVRIGAPVENRSRQDKNFVQEMEAEVRRMLGEIRGEQPAPLS